MMYYIYNRNRNRKKKKGVTIVELVTALSCLTLILTIAIAVFRMGIRVNFNTKEEYKLQSYMRQATDLITEKIRYSSAVFVLPKSEFNKKNIEEHNYLQNDWDYIGALEAELEDGRTGYEIVMYQYNPDAGEGAKRHVKTVLVPATDQFHFDMELNKTDPSVDNKLINFVLSAFKYGENSAYMEVDSKAEALNSLQIQDYSTTRNVGKAIAFRSDSRFAIVGRIVLVLDVSSSMRFEVDSNNPAADDESRMDLLKPLVKDMITQFSGYQNLELCIITYDDTADLGRFNDPNYIKLGEKPPEPLYDGNQYYFMRPNDDDMKKKLLKFVDNLTPRGSTNTGDALRRARYAFKRAKNNGDVTKVSNYLIVITDGDTRYGVLDPSKVLPKVSSEGLSADAELALAKSTFQNLPWLKDDGDVTEYNESGAPVEGIRLRPRYSYKESTEKPGYANLLGYPGGTREADKILVGDGSYLTEHATYYMQFHAGEMRSESGPTSYVVALSEVSKKGRDDLASSLGVKMAGEDSNLYEITSNDDDQFQKAIEEITDSILQDLWFINGPRRYAID